MKVGGEEQKAECGYMYGEWNWSFTAKLLCRCETEGLIEMYFLSNRNGFSVLYIIINTF